MICTGGGGGLKEEQCLPPPKSKDITQRHPKDKPEPQCWSCRGRSPPAGTTGEKAGVLVPPECTPRLERQKWGGKRGGRHPRRTKPREPAPSLQRQEAGRAGALPLFPYIDTHTHTPLCCSKQPPPPPLRILGSHNAGRDDRGALSASLPKALPRLKRLPFSSQAWLLSKRAGSGASRRSSAQGHRRPPPIPKLRPTRVTARRSSVFAKAERDRRGKDGWMGGGAKKPGRGRRRRSGLEPCTGPRRGSPLLAFFARRSALQAVEDNAREGKRERAQKQRPGRGGGGEGRGEGLAGRPPPPLAALTSAGHAQQGEPSRDHRCRVAAAPRRTHGEAPALPLRALSLSLPALHLHSSSPSVNLC